MRISASKMDFLGPGIERIYQGVINDVIKQVKEDFEDEGVGEDVLLQLKKVWQHKSIKVECSILALMQTSSQTEPILLPSRKCE
uniref:Uncharacterized protein n=1 Tax=Ditylenchus dipsaci TaxID=166011 RepID=A0A915D7X1_9BILA